MMDGNMEMENDKNVAKDDFDWKWVYGCDGSW